MISVVLAGGLVLLGGPGWVRVSGRRGHPAHFARNAVSVQLMGFALVEAGLLLSVTPTLLDLIGAADLALICRRIFGGLAPGGLAGAIGGALAVVLAGAAGGGAYRVLAAQRRLRIEGWLGSHSQRGEHTLVILPTSELIAYAVGGRPPQVVLSSGMFDAVGRQGAEAVIAHEAVHVSRRHHRFLLATGAIEGAFGWYPLAARGARMVRLALERWADEESADTIGDGREGMRRTLLAATEALVAPEVASFGAADTISERAQALSMPAPHSRSLWGVVSNLSVRLGALVCLGWLAWATWMSMLAVANPGLCVL
ncbi:MAG: M56 family metallopeptidase [Acidimicrobiia bacterium]